LFDFAGFDESGFAQLAINALGQFDVFRRVGRVPVIELDMKALKILWAFGCDARDELLGCDALGLGFEHDGRAVGIVGTNEMYGMSRHTH